MKIFDCCIYFNELHLLQYRIAECYEYVDYFIIVSATQDHKGTPNSSLDLNLIDKIYHDKIIYKLIEFPCTIPNNIENFVKRTNDHINNYYIHWWKEYYQRECIKDSLDELADDDDLCIISDLDEICNYKLLLEYLKEFNLFDKLENHYNRTFCFNIHYQQNNCWHCCSFSTPYRIIKDRNDPNSCLALIRFRSNKNIKGETIENLSAYSLGQPYLYKDEPIFNHFNRFCINGNVLKKEQVMSENYIDSRNIEDLLNIRNNFKKILLGNLGGKDNDSLNDNDFVKLKHVNFKFSDKLYQYFPFYFTTSIDELHKIWNDLKDLNDEEFVKQVNAIFYK